MSPDGRDVHLVQDRRGACRDVPHPDGATTGMTHATGGMTMESEAPPRSGDPFQEEMDELSLRQALVDFDVANARVVDLTQRLVEAQGTISDLRTQLETLRIEHAQLKSLHERMRSSQAFRT